MKPLQLGITGGIGSGKSVVCEILKTLGFPVFNSDLESRMLLSNNPKVVKNVKQLLGNAAYLTDGQPDRKYIAEQVFQNGELLNQLNSILHPEVRIAYQSWVACRLHHRLVVKEAAIMFESGAWVDLDHIVAVVAPLPLRINRIMQRDHKTEAEIMLVVNRQMAENELIQRSNRIIVNDDQQLIMPQILQMLEELSVPLPQ
jgi:dephospho-CoA kinase